MRDFLVVLIVLGSVPLTLVRPHIGILMWFWLGMMNPHRLTWGYAQEFRVALVVGCTTVFAWLISNERKVAPSIPIVYALAGLTVWVTVAAVMSIHPETALPKWEQIIKILLMTFVTMCIVQSHDRIDQLVWVIVVSLGFYGIKGGIFAILTGGEYKVWGPADSFIADNNAVALALIVVLPLMQYLRVTATRYWVSLGLLGSMGLSVIAILASYSRGAFIGIAMMLGLLLLKARRRAPLILATVGVLVLGLAMLPQQWHERMWTIEHYDEDSSVQGRFDAWNFAFKLALDHPFVGGGQLVGTDDALFKRYVPTAETSRSAHSIYFEVLGETGFVGLGLFLFLLLTSYFTATNIIRSTRGRPDLAWARSLASMLQVSVVGYAVTGAALNVGFFDLYYALIAVLTGTQVVVRRELTKPSPVPGVTNAKTPIAGPAPAVAAAALSSAWSGAPPRPAPP